MTVTTIRQALRHIKAQANDDERAHSLEDDLHVAVLTAIAGGVGDPRALAREALKTKDIKFSRYCA